MCTMYTVDVYNVHCTCVQCTLYMCVGPTYSVGDVIYSWRHIYCYGFEIL